MRVWVIAAGEPWPTDTKETRLLRGGALANYLQARGHLVTWWNSTFDHTMKHPRFERSLEMTAGSGLKIMGLYGRAYQTNVSLRRILNHAQIAAEFKRLSTALSVPDVTFVSYPPIELADEVVRYTTQKQIPSVIDIRDLWPDIWLEVVSRPIRPLAKLALRPFYRSFQRTIRRCTAVTGITDAVIDWALSATGRPRNDLDHPFPMAYPECIYARNEQAEAYWSNLGIRGYPEQFIVCFTGTLSRRLSAELLTVIRAAALLEVSSTKKVIFVICGTGEFEQTLRRKADGLGNVIFPGWIDKNLIWALMGRASAGLIPYPQTPDFLRSLPNKFFEYLAGGLPIITCLDGEVRRHVETNRCGEYYAPGNAHQLAGLLAGLANDQPLWSAMRDRARAVAECFRPDIIYGNFADFLETLAGMNIGAAAKGGREQKSEARDDAHCSARRA